MGNLEYMAFRNNDSEEWIVRPINWVGTFHKLGNDYRLIEGRHLGIFFGSKEQANEFIKSGLCKSFCEEILDNTLIEDIDTDFIGKRIQDDVLVKGKLTISIEHSDNGMPEHYYKEHTCVLYYINDDMVFGHTVKRVGNI